ncbi:MAG: glycine cleavage system protein GcvH [Clostridiales bacterium]|nr:glycine cleavage system protein GcvH [Clostridiales bacterium]
MNFPKELRYSKSHEWVKEDGDSVVIGLTDFAQKELGDIVFINVPFVGDAVTAGASFADIESVKAVSEIISPVTGTVAEVNESLVDTPEKINEAPYEAWIVRVNEISDREELLSAEEYEQLTKEG